LEPIIKLNWVYPRKEKSRTEDWENGGYTGIRRFGGRNKVTTTWDPTINKLNWEYHGREKVELKSGKMVATPGFDALAVGTK